MHACAGGGGGGRSGSGARGSSSETRPPILGGGAGTVPHGHSSSSTLTPLATFSTFLAIFSSYFHVHGINSC